MKKRLMLVVGAVGLTLMDPGFSRAAEAATNAPPQSNPSFSAANSGKRAAWQERLTLGPGDSLNFSLFETNEVGRTEVVIGPDGRVSFLQAENVMATGLTIDELRAKFDAELGKYYRNPLTIITPVAYRSKRYVVLGTVTAGGVFTMDRPLTVIEAIARAGGLETGMHERGTVELADLTRSFLARKQQRVPVDFERLFQRGDLTQNVALEPDDYIYIGAAGANEIYVLGQVGNPGVLTFAPKATLISAIASRGGFSGKAFKSRVLVVRGSLTHPETFVVDTADILSGKSPDFKLQQKDIVYVSVSPWMKAAEVLDNAAQAFIQAFTVTATTLNIGPIITTPLIK
ncbi:MAG: polysaccharide biosynthesis/export family protein [Verrucomicrobiota bacterium]|nr:polysaccharide biosynthesis/export family protein [Verrucomicrobiota bacterium]MCC6823415.1 polysaccharide biosynthesis/export family protein [Limisphaerales bacterium]